MKSIISRNVVTLIIGRLLLYLFNILSTMIVARKLGPVEYGYYSIIFIYYAFILIMTDLGLQTLAVRDGSQDTAELGSVAGNLFWLKMILTSTILIISVIIFLESNYNYIIRTGFAIIAINIFFVALLTVPNVIFQVKLALHYSVLSDIAGQLVLLILILIFYFDPLPYSPIYFFLTANVISSFLTFVLGLYFASKLVKIKWHLDLSVTNKIIKNTLPLSIIILLSQVHFKGDSLILSFLKTERDVGIYNVAYKFFESSLILPSVLLTIIFPILSRNATNQKDMYPIADKSFTILSLTGIAAASAIFFLAQYFVLWTAGSNFKEAIPVLKILSFAVCFSFINSIFAYIIIALNRQKDILIVSITAVGLNILLNILFIPKYSYKACAVITVFSEFYGMVLMGYLAYKSSGFHPFLKYTKKALG